MSKLIKISIIKYEFYNNETDMKNIKNFITESILNEEKRNGEIGDGTFPNAYALLDKPLSSVKKLLINNDFESDEYGETDIKGFGYADFKNEETEQEVMIIYQWIKQGKDSYKAGNVVRAEVYNDLIYHEKPYDIATLPEYEDYRFFR